MIALFKSIPTGQRYSETLQATVIEELATIKGLGSAQKIPGSVSGALINAINAIDLDWRVPFPKPVIEKSGKSTTVKFDGIAWVTSIGIDGAVETSLNLDNGVPALVKGFNPGWPLASYRLDYKGSLTDYADITFYFGGRDFGKDLSSMRLYQWDGEIYRDITTIVDLPNKIIKGRTDKLSTFVIMSRVDEGKYVKVPEIKPNLTLPDPRKRGAG